MTTAELVLMCVCIATLAVLMPLTLWLMFKIGADQQ